jgi:hypothetical protein
MYLYKSSTIRHIPPLVSASLFTFDEALAVIPSFALEVIFRRRPLHAYQLAVFFERKIKSKLSFCNTLCPFKKHSR